jgi:hypothetical protein
VKRGAYGEQREPSPAPTSRATRPQPVWREGGGRGAVGVCVRVSVRVRPLN